MDVQDKVLASFADRKSTGKPFPIYTTKDSGIYATRVRIESPQGSVFNGQVGPVTRLVGDTLYVRLRVNGKEASIPFGRGEVVVIP